MEPRGSVAEREDEQSHLTRDRYHVAEHCPRVDVAALGDPDEVARLNAADVPGRRIIHLASPLDAPSVALTARRADAVILVVALGEDTMDAVERVKEMLGVETILGCVAANVRPRKR